jgi:hypothetical protein
MAADDATAGYSEARRMLDICASGSADAVDLTITDSAGDKEQFRRNVSLAKLTRMLPALLDDAGRRRRNVIVRPHGPGITFLQLDDLDAEKLAHLHPAMYLALETSPGNHQAWLAILGDPGKDFARRVRKGTGADSGASGTTRISGSLNFKEKYAPAFPRVETVYTSPGLVVPRDRLEALGLVAPPERTEPVPPPARALTRRVGPRRWPDYQRCVDNAPPAQEGGRPDISRADFTWCMTAIDWGWSVEETATRLLQESSKAQENGESYALRTARNAAAAVERRREWQR